VDTLAVAKETMVSAAAGVFEYGTEDKSVAADVTETGSVAAALTVAEETRSSPGTVLNVPRLPFSMPYGVYPPTNSPKMDVPNVTADGRRLRSDHPTWLASPGKLQNFVTECHDIVAKLRELMTQREALKADARAPSGAPSTTGLVERERRGAIWEDALRELSISQVRTRTTLEPWSHSLIPLTPSFFPRRTVSTTSCGPWRARCTRTSTPSSRSR
jgi:hypothetical protein